MFIRYPVFSLKAVFQPEETQVKLLFDSKAGGQIRKFTLEVLVNERKGGIIREGKIHRWTKIKAIIISQVHGR